MSNRNFKNKTIEEIICKFLEEEFHDSSIIYEVVRKQFIDIHEYSVDVDFYINPSNCYVEVTFYVDLDKETISIYLESESYAVLEPKTYSIVPLYIEIADIFKI